MQSEAHSFQGGQLQWRGQDEKILQQAMTSLTTWVIPEILKCFVHDCKHFSVYESVQGHLDGWSPVTLVGAVLCVRICTALYTHLCVHVCILSTCMYVCVYILCV